MGRRRYAMSHRVTTMLAAAFLAIDAPASSSLAPLPVSPVEFSSVRWTSIDLQSLPLAGIRAPDEAFRSLNVRVICDGNVRNGSLLEFSIALDSMFEIFLNTTFFPGLAEGAVSFEFSVDGDNTIELKNVSSEWHAGLLSVTGSTAAPDAMPALEAGNEVGVDVRLSGQVIFTQSFTLRGSSDALANLNCL